MILAALLGIAVAVFHSRNMIWAPVAIATYSIIGVCWFIIFIVSYTANKDNLSADLSLLYNIGIGVAAGGLFSLLI